MLTPLLLADGTRFEALNSKIKGMAPHAADLLLFAVTRLLESLKWVAVTLNEGTAPRLLFS